MISQRCLVLWILKATIYKTLADSADKKNALEMQSSLCSKELFLLSFERNSIWLKQVDYYLMKFMPLSINPETLFGHETKNDERW